LPAPNRALPLKLVPPIAPVLNVHPTTFAGDVTLIQCSAQVGTRNDVPEASRTIRETDGATGASGSSVQAIAGSGPSRGVGNRLTTSQAVGFGILCASPLDPRSSAGSDPGPR
jgi:hypothetical protein